MSKQKSVLIQLFQKTMKKEHPPASTGHKIYKAQDLNNY